MRTSLLLLVMLLVGCDDGATSGPLGGGTPSPLLSPYHGQWRFDLEKTLAAWKSDGVSQQELDQARAIAHTIPLHGDLNFTGNSIILPGRPEGEYTLFALHQHGSRVCGKAWHHEDRHDPGDMSKCYIRIELKGSMLHLSLRHDAGSVNVNDPDINMPATSPANNCGADAATDPPWSPWRTYIFTKAP